MENVKTSDPRDRGIFPLTWGTRSSTLKRVSRLRSWIPLACLLAYGTLFAAQAFSLRELLAYDDHPGQFVRLWMGLKSLRHGAWTADWHPEWFAGYPELQFYPPGFVILGLLIHGITLAQLPLETIYQLLLWVIYLLPGFTTFLLLRTLTSSPWAALPAAFVALTLSAGLPSGVEDGMRWGMIGARLGIGLLPLLVLSLLPWVRDGRWPIWCPPILAAILLAHPYQFVPALLIVLLTGLALCGWIRRQRRVAAQTIALITLALGLAAFWLLPLLFRLTYTLPMAWSRGEWRLLFTRPILLSLLPLYILGFIVVLRGRDELWSLRVAVALLPLTVLLAAGLDRVILVEMWGILTFDPDRLRDGGVYASLWAAALGWAWGIRRILGSRAWGAGLAASFFLAIIPQNDRNPDLTLWPVRQPWPTVRQVETEVQLPALRQALRAAPPGRIFFSTSGIRLEDGEAWYLPHSHLLAMIPIQVNREIINGTFTHPSPIAGLVYTGNAGARGIVRLVEELDGHQLLGRPFANLEPARLNHLLDVLKVSTVVVPSKDSTLISSLEASHLFNAPVAVGPFRLFQRRAPTEMPTRQEHRTLRLLLPSSSGEWVGTGLFAYPLWSAVGPQGPLPVRESPERLLEVFVPPGREVVATLRYREGAAEWIGLSLTILSLGAWGVGLLRSS